MSRLSSDRRMQQGRHPHIGGPHLVTCWVCRGTGKQQGMYDDLMCFSCEGTGQDAIPWTELIQPSRVAALHARRQLNGPEMAS